jgi:hypothetical protein
MKQFQGWRYDLRADAFSRKIADDKRFFRGPFRPLWNDA